MKKKFVLFSMLTAVTVCTVAVAIMSGGEGLIFPAMVSATDKALVLDHTNAPEINDGIGVLNISGATFTYTNASASSEGHVALAKDGTIIKDISKGLTSVRSTFTGSLSLETGFNEDDFCFSYDLTSGVAQEIRGNYLKFVAETAVDIQNINLSYNCREEEPESHNMSNWASVDDEKHERHCVDDHCHKFEEAPHTLNDSGIDTSLSSTGGTITYTCSICGYSFDEDYVRTGAGKVALGSSRGSTTFDSKLGASIQTYAVAAWRTGLTRIGNEGAVVFQMRAAQSPGSDGTGTGAGFRIMSGFNQATADQHTYSYAFKNMGSNVINFQVYGRTGSGDTSAVNAYDVSLEPGESTNVNVIFATQNSNILSYFRFLDTSYQDASLAISLRYNPTAIFNVTLTNALFDNGLDTKEFTPGSTLSGIETELDYLGFSDNLGNVNSTSKYTVPESDVEVTLITDDRVVAGSGKLAINEVAKTSIDNYGVNCGRANPEYTYIGDELATVFTFASRETPGSDGTGTNASFRFRVIYNSGSGYRSNFYYTFKNMGTETLEFDVYQRSSGTDTSTPTYTRISIEPNEVATADIFWETNVTTNELTYVRFTEGTNWVNQKLAVYAYAEAYPSSYYKVTLAEGMTFDDGRSYGYFASGTTQNINNIPEPKTEGHVHAGYYLAESGVIQNSTTFVVPGANRTVYPFYDVEAYYDHSTAPDLTNSYQKIDLSSTGTVGGGGLHPSAGRSGSFQDKKPTIGQATLINNDGELEKCIKYTFSDAVTAGSHFLNMNAVHSTNKNVDSYFVIQNNGNETLVLNLYTTTSSGNPTATILATNVTVAPGASVAVEKLNHGNGSNSNTMVCFEIVDALTSMDFSVVRYMRYHS